MSAHALTSRTSTEETCLPRACTSAMVSRSRRSDCAPRTTSAEPWMASNIAQSAASPAGTISRRGLLERHRQRGIVMQTLFHALGGLHRFQDRAVRARATARACGGRTRR